MNQTRVFFIILIFSFVFVNITVGGIFKSADFVKIDDDEIIDRDLYVTCRVADLYGEVYGDLAVACQRFNLDGKIAQNLYCAGEKIVIDGEVQGDILGFAKDIELNGKALGGFRGGCQSLIIEGLVDGDVIVGAQWVVISKRAVIKGDVYIGAGELIVEGEIHGEVKGAVGELIVSGFITEDVVIHSEGIEIEAEGRIGGDLVYKNDETLDIDNRGNVEGEIVFVHFDEPEFDCTAFGWLWKLILLGMAVATGIILALVFREQIRDSFEDLRDNFGRTLLVGFLALIVMPVVAIISFFPVITIPAGLIIFTLYLIFLYLGWILVGVITGYFLLNIKFSEPSVVLAAILGIIILMILAMIPFLGGLICLGATVIGLGVVLSALYRIFWGS